jgi:DNA-binding LacI/PurR family transcriptional regulator
VATRAEVAKLAGVSASTVSYALSGQRPIREETRRRIEAAMKQLNYTPNALASGLARRRSHLLALLFPPQPDGVGSFDLEYVMSAADLARERGYHLVLWTLGENETTAVRRLGGSGLVDGVLLMEVRLDDERVRLFQSAGIPMALIGRTADPQGLAFADSDFDQITRLAIDHLVALGHRFVGLVNLSHGLVELGHAPSARVADGAVRAAAELGVDLVTLDCLKSVSAGREALDTLIARSPGLTAIISFNWEATVGVMQRAAATGMAIPERLSVLSITNSSRRADITTPSLTTISPPAAEVGRAAAAALIDQLETPGAAPRQVLLPGALVTLGSTGPARQRGMESSGGRRPSGLRTRRA